MPKLNPKRAPKIDRNGHQQSSYRSAESYAFVFSRDIREWSGSSKKRKSNREGAKKRRKNGKDE